MEEKILKKENKFVDNVAYKNKFQFLIWVNDNVICQRYFKINGFNEESVYTAEFNDCMNSIVDSIQEDLESKSRIFMWYTNTNEPLKLTGFLSQEDLEKYDSAFIASVINCKKDADIVAPDGKVFHITYMDTPKDVINDYGEAERPAEGEFTFKFAFLIDDVPVFERIWDGNVYPKFVRNGVDLTNTYSSYDNKDISSLSFGAAVIRYMQSGKANLISDFIRRICDTMSNTFTDKYEYTMDMEEFKNTPAQCKGTIMPEVTGHIDITPENKSYNYYSAYEAYKRSWKKAVKKKTEEYYNTMYPSNRQIEYIERHY